MIKYILSACFLLITALLFYFAEIRLGIFKQEIIRLATERVQEEIGWQLTVEGVHFVFPSKITIDQVKFKNDHSPVLELVNVQLHLNPLELLRQQIGINSIQIDSLAIFKEALNPKLKKNDIAHETSIGSVNVSSWDSLPEYFKIDQLLIHQLILDETLIASLPNELKEKTFTGPLRLIANIALDRNAKTAIAGIELANENKEDIIKFNTTVTHHDDLLNIQVRCTAWENGIVSQVFKLSPKYTIKTLFKASAPIATWKSVFENRSFFHQNEIKGDFQISYSNETNQVLEHLPEKIFGNNGLLKGTFATSHEQFRILEFKGIIGLGKIEGCVALNSDFQLDGTALKIVIPDSSYLNQFSKLKSQGALHTQFSLSGKLTSPSIDLELRNDSISFEEHSFQNIRAHFKSNISSEILDGSFTIHGKHQSQMVHFSADYNWLINREIQFSKVSLDIPQAHVTGNFSLSLINNSVDVDLKGSADIALLSQISGQKMNGMALFDINLQHIPNKISSLKLILAGKKMEFGDVLTQDATITATLSGTIDKPNGEIKITAKNASWDKWEITNLVGETNVDPSLNMWPFLVSFNSNDNGKLELHSKGFWLYSPQAIQVSLDKFHAKIMGYPIVLQNPTQLKIQNDELLLSRSTLSIGGGVLQAELKYNPHEIWLKSELKELPLSIIHQIFPDLPPVTGIASGSTELTESAQGLNGSLKVDISNFNFLEEPFATPEPMQGSFTAEVSHDAVICSGNVTGFGSEPIVLNATLPLMIALRTPEFEINKQKQLSAHLALKGPFAALIELFTTNTATNMTGHANIEIDLAGTLKTPQLTGHAVISEGTFESLDLGTTLKNIEAHIDLNGKNAVLTKLTAVDGQNGIVTGRGSAEIDFEKHFPFELLIDLEKVAVLYLDFTSATASGQLKWNGNSFGATLSGKLVADSFIVDLPDQTSAITEPMEITYVNQPTDSVAPTRYVDRTSDWPLSFDVQVEVPSKGIISGTNLSSEWKGQAVITGTSSSPLINGTYKIIKGEYRINGKPFQVREGFITFAGNLEKKTTLYVIASHEIDSINVDIILKGSMKNPSISLRSNPPMSQRDILSWLLFNRGASEITPFQGTQLNESITDLLKENSEPDLLTRIRNRLGIDRIDISRPDSTSNEVSLQVGKYLSKGLYVSVNKSVTADAKRLAVEANLIKNFKVQAEVGDDSEAQLFLKWKKDY